MNKKATLGTWIIGVSVMLVFLFQSCQKYEDGPLISIRSWGERISNTWKVDNLKINGSDYTSIVTNYTETFTKSGTYTYDWSLLNGSGTWKFQNNDEEVILNGNDDHSSRTLIILKLEEKQFWYYTMVGNDKYEYHLVEN